jgi:hypothetical protein
MASAFDRKTFRSTLASLSFAQQRQVAARFVANVLDIVGGDSRLKHIIDVLQQPDATAEDLEVAHRTIRSIYVETHPHSELQELDFHRQAAHFITEACLACTGASYAEARTIHLAQRIAKYCRMARTCSSMPREEEQPDFSIAEKAAAKIIADQYAILADYLEEKGLAPPAG